MLSVLSAVILCLLTLHDADARRMPLDPQNRLHLGLNMVEGFNLGVTGGLDTRLTRVIYVDVGGFVSTMPPVEGTLDPINNPEDWINLRHSLYLTPGLRLPHRSSAGFTWDLTARVGAGSVWSTDHSVVETVQSDVGLISGGDFIIRYEQFGMRMSGKALYFRPFSLVVRDELSLIRPQFALEALYQW